MTFHSPRQIERKIRNTVVERARKVSLSNPMITACPERTAEIAWFFATRGDDSLQPRKILPPTLGDNLDTCTSVQTQRVLTSLNKAINGPSSFPCTSVHPSSISPLPSPLVQVLEYPSPVVECVGGWGVLAFSALPRTFSMVLTMPQALNLDRPVLDMTYDTPYIWRTNYIQNQMYIKTLFHFVRTIYVTYTRFLAFLSHIEIDTYPTYGHT